MPTVEGNNANVMFIYCDLKTLFIYHVGCILELDLSHFSIARIPGQQIWDQIHLYLKVCKYIFEVFVIVQFVLDINKIRRFFFILSKNICIGQIL